MKTAILFALIAVAIFEQSATAEPKFQDQRITYQNLSALYCEVTNLTASYATTKHEISFVGKSALEEIVSGRSLYLMSFNVDEVEIEAQFDLPVDIENAKITFRFIENRDQQNEIRVIGGNALYSSFLNHGMIYRSGKKGLAVTCWMKPRI